MRRVVVTGMGIWSCLGQNLQTVTESLKHGRGAIKTLVTIQNLYDYIDKNL